MSIKPQKGIIKPFESIDAKIFLKLKITEDDEIWAHRASQIDNVNVK